MRRWAWLPRFLFPGLSGRRTVTTGLEVEVVDSGLLH